MGFATTSVSFSNSEGNNSFCFEAPQGDLDADGVADYSILLSGVSDLSVHDLFL